MSAKNRLFAFALADQMQGHDFTDDVAICKATSKRKAIRKFRQLYGLADETNVFEVRLGKGAGMVSELAFRMREDGYLMQINQLREENNNLRVLVDGLRYCAKASHGRCAIRDISRGGNRYVTCCPLYDTGSGTAKCGSLMRKLGIEVR